MLRAAFWPALRMSVRRSRSAVGCLNCGVDNICSLATPTSRGVGVGVATVRSLCSTTKSEEEGRSGGGDAKVVHDAQAQIFKLEIEGAAETAFLKYRLLDRNGGEYRFLCGHLAWVAYRHMYLYYFFII